MDTDPIGFQDISGNNYVDHVDESGRVTKVVRSDVLAFQTFCPNCETEQNVPKDEFHVCNECGCLFAASTPADILCMDSFAPRLALARKVLFIAIALLAGLFLLVLVWLILLIKVPGLACKFGIPFPLILLNGLPLVIGLFFLLSVIQSVKTQKVLLGRWSHYKRKNPTVFYVWNGLFGIFATTFILLFIVPFVL